MMMITSPAHRSSRPFSFSACASSCLTCTFLCMSCLISPCRTFMYSALPPCLSFSQMSCHATPSIIERSGEASDGMDETTSCPSSFLLHLRQRSSASLPPVLLLFLLISSSLVATVSPSLSFALSSCSSLSCFRRVLSFYRLISWMTKRQKDRIDKLRGTGGTMTEVVFWVFFSWL